MSKTKKDMQAELDAMKAMIENFTKGSAPAPATPVSSFAAFGDVALAQPARQVKQENRDNNASWKQVSIINAYGRQFLNKVIVGKKAKVVDDAIVTEYFTVENGSQVRLTKGKASDYIEKFKAECGSLKFEKRGGTF
jgi:hypothetical protein